MLKITVGKEELFDEVEERFIVQGGLVLELEHSLISLSKWESEFQKPFLTLLDKSSEEVLGYVRAMVVSDNFSPEDLTSLNQSDLDEITAYIESSQSATTFGELPERKTKGETITSELIYYWMVAYSIPFECQYWHLNRLFALIRICNIKNSKPKRMSRREIAARNKELNDRRRAEFGTSG